MRSVAFLGTSYQGARPFEPKSFNVGVVYHHLLSFRGLPGFV